MTYAAAALWVLAAGAFGALATVAVRSWVPFATRQRNHTVGVTAFQQLAVIHAVLLAFVFNEAWGEYTIAATAVNTESAALHAVIELARALPPEQGAAVRGLAVDYMHTVVDQEWPSMVHRRDAPQAVLAMRQLLAGVGGMTLPAAAEAVRVQMLALLATAQANRETRLFQMSQAVPVVLWALLILFSMALACFIAFFGIEQPGLHMLFAGLFAGGLAMVLVIIALFDLPFEGSVHIGPQDFLATLARLDPPG